MTVRERLKNLLTHPLTGGAFVLSAFGQIGFGLFEPAWGLVSATAGMWFPAVSVSAATILPELGLEREGTLILVAGAVVFVMVKLDQAADRAAEYFNNR